MSRARISQSGFTLIEMLTTVAILVIVLGLMVSLARDVRKSSADVLTKDLLRQLDAMMAVYIDHNGGQLPPVDLLLPDEQPAAAPARPGQPASQPALPDEATLAAAAKRNNEQYVRALKIDYRKQMAMAPIPAVSAEPGQSGASQQPPTPIDDPFDKAPFQVGVYDLRTIRDAWGSPIVFMPRQHELIGLAPSRAGQDQFFFFSAGPDRKYLSRFDNLYSYETAK